MVVLPLRDGVASLLEMPLSLLEVNRGHSACWILRRSYELVASPRGHRLVEVIMAFLLDPRRRDHAVSVIGRLGRRRQHQTPIEVRGPPLLLFALLALLAVILCQVPVVEALAVRADAETINEHGDSGRKIEEEEETNEATNPCWSFMIFWTSERVRASLMYRVVIRSRNCFQGLTIVTALPTLRNLALKRK